MMDESHLLSITTSRLLRAGDIETNPGPYTNSTIDDNELHKVVTTATYFDVPMFTRIGLALGFTPEEVHGFVVKHGVSGAFAYMPLQEIFSIWSKNLPHDTNVRAAFIEKLWEANTHDFADRLLGNFTAPFSWPSPSDTPLTEKQILQCSFDLRDHYRITRNGVKLGKFAVMPTDDLLEVSLSKHEKYAKERRLITYDDLIDMNLSHRILVEGGAGVGKTTLCSKIAWDWCQGKVLTQLDMVIVIPLGNLDVNLSIGEVTKTYLSKSNTSTAAQIERFIHEHPDKVMIILDGLDEYKGSISAEKNMTNVASVLRSNRFPTCRVIATTRPRKVGKILPLDILLDNMRLVYIQEFGLDTQTAFIKSFFRTRGEESLAEELMIVLKKNDVMAEITSPLPFYSALLCILWDLVSNKECPDILKLQTHSQLIEELIRFLKEEYISKMCEDLTEEKTRQLSRDVDERILQVGEMAFEGLLGNTPAFPEHKLTQWKDAVDTCCEIGILTEVEEVISSISKPTIADSKPSKSSVTFPHRIFQEYLSSLYLASLYGSNHEKYKELVMRVLLRHEEFHLLLMFTASFGRDIGLDITRKLVDQHASLDICASVAFECRVEEVGRVVGSNVKMVEVKRETPAHSAISQLFLLKWCPLESLTVADISCGRTTSRFLGDVVYSSPTLSTASIHCPHLDADFCSILRRTERAEGAIQTLEMDIGSFSCSAAAAEDIATFLLQLPCLKTLTLQCYDMPDVFFAKADSLAASSQVKELDLDLGRKKLKTSPGSDMAAKDLARLLMQSG
ncbi:NLR family CARD domain-containing protein 4-like [Diadema antillarum]|uniref:NLR family CARD domain-containing protein 4-like n=1 Tax=Diadema antillarum TaxID=105358 RepID=UPI003A88632F